MEFNIVVPNYIEIKSRACPYCFGTGKLKAMQSVAIYGGGSIRGKDAQVKCKFCNGVGTFKSL